MITRRLFGQLGLGVSAWALAAPVFRGTAQAQALAEEQIVHVGLGFDDIRTLDPQMAVASSDIPIVPHIYESLAAFPGGELGSEDLRPMLAERWESSPDGREWTFHLRQGVQWQGGYGPFTSADVKFSLERLAGDTIASPFRQSFGDVESLDADDPQVFRIVLKRGDPFLLQRLVNFQMGFIVCKAAVEAGVDLATTPVGTGPFQFSEYRPREDLTLVRNPDYWGTAPVIEEIVYHLMPTANSRELALQAGEVDLIDIEARRDAVERVRQLGVEVDISTIGAPQVLHVNLTKPPFDDLRVRQALAHATDRENLVAFMGPELVDAEYSCVPMGYLGHLDDLPRLEYDVERARALLAEAGLPDGFTTQVIISNSTMYLPVMQVLQEQWKKAGIVIELQVVDHPTFHRLIREDASPLVLYWADRYPKTAQVYLTQFYAKDAAIGLPTAITNFSHYGEAIPGVDDLLAQVDATSDPEERKRLWAEAQQKMAADLPAIPLFAMKGALGRSPRLEIGYPIGVLTYLTFESAKLLEA